eukprot:767405-Hanusia_phi.AAC.3
MGANRSPQKSHEVMTAERWEEARNVLIALAARWSHEPTGRTILTQICSAVAVLVCKMESWETGVVIEDLAVSFAAAKTAMLVDVGMPSMFRLLTVNSDRKPFVFCRFTPSQVLSWTWLNTFLQEEVSSRHLSIHPQRRQNVWSSLKQSFPRIAEYLILMWREARESEDISVGLCVIQALNAWLDHGCGSFQFQQSEVLREVPVLLVSRLSSSSSSQIHHSCCLHHDFISEVLEERTCLLLPESKGELEFLPGLAANVASSPCRAGRLFLTQPVRSSELHHNYPRAFNCHVSLPQVRGILCRQRGADESSSVCNSSCRLLVTLSLQAIADDMERNLPDWMIFPQEEDATQTFSQSLSTWSSAREILEGSLPPVRSYPPPQRLNLLCPGPSSSFLLPARRGLPNDLGYLQQDRLSQGGGDEGS